MPWVPSDLTGGFPRVLGCFKSGAMLGMRKKFHVDCLSFPSVSLQPDCPAVQPCLGLFSKRPQLLQGQSTGHLLAWQPSVVDKAGA